MNTFRRILSLTLLILLATGLVSRAETGPGVPPASGEVSTSSPDWRDYIGTGGVARGSMSIDSSIPKGCIDSCALDVKDPIVAVKEKYSYEDLVRDLGLLEETYGAHMAVDQIGRTADGRRLYEATVGNPNAAVHVLITAGIHAREYITCNLAMKQLEYLLAYYEDGCFDGKSLAQWFGEVCVHFVPMVNPDGVTLSQSGVDALSSSYLRALVTDTYNREFDAGKTALFMDQYTVLWKANARGVNLNGNFDALTDKVPRTTGLPSSDAYYGKTASESETVALQRLIDRTHFQAIINYHATGSVLYWDFTENPLREHCRDLANNIKAITGYPLMTSGDEGGTAAAYAGTRKKPSTSLTIEVGRSPAPVNIGEMPVIWSENKFVPFYAMKWAKEKGK